MFLLIFSTTFIGNISHSRNNSVRYCHKCENVFMQSRCYSCRISMRPEFSQQIFEKKLKCQISWKSVQWEPSCSMWTDGQTDGQKGMTKLIVAFCNFANAPKDDMENYVRKKGTVNWRDIAGQSWIKEREAAVLPGEWIHTSVWPAQCTDGFGTILTVSGNAAISVRYELNFNIIRLNFRLQRGKFKDTALHCLSCTLEIMRWSSTEEEEEEVVCGSLMHWSWRPWHSRKFHSLRLDKHTGKRATVTISSIAEVTCSSSWRCLLSLSVSKHTVVIEHE